MTTNLTGAVWRKSARSDNSGQCVEVAQVPGVTGVRDSKDATGPALVVTPADWHTFTTAAKSGTFHR
ncbi:DUF397 domain-containing protein [Longispora sp. NPDC051575]|uniref:DUF397 domain-containing protein n=1 Tax=Longispora sp. NPDC051575 TaxID=3154943 RepID=UPI00342F87E0